MRKCKNCGSKFSPDDGFLRRRFKKEDMLKAYGFEYAYFGKEVYISRNDAELSQPVNYNTVIGLNGANFLYLK